VTEYRAESWGLTHDQSFRGDSVTEGHLPVLDLALVSMPYAAISSPSLGISILKSVCDENGFSARCFYPNLDWAEAIGQDFYDFLSAGNPHTTDLLGEWTFATYLFPNKHIDTDFLKRVSDRSARIQRCPDDFFRRLSSLPELVECFINQTAAHILRSGPRSVGLTSTFQQHLPSLALAKKLKTIDPSVITIIGGANCEGAMGAATVRNFPFIDLAVSGEAEEALPRILSAFSQGEQYQRRGLFYQGAATLGAADRLPPVSDLDKIPYPDFADYFSALDFRNLNVDIQIPVETSRGCWWGEKSHCTFCGLNGSSMRYRFKDPASAAADIARAAGETDSGSIVAVDNILSLDYFGEFMDRLAELNKTISSFSVFYEVKANLKRWQFEKLKSAGINELQPGIESLSTSVLKLMRKGIRAVDNIKFLKLTREFGITAHWNIIWGFPGEVASDYDEMANLITQLHHLPPPGGCAQLRYDRFSPYHTDAKSHGLILKHHSGYRNVYELPESELDEIAYFFECQNQDVSVPEKMLSSVGTWQKSHQETELVVARLGDATIIFRVHGIDSIHALHLSDIEARCLEVVDEPTPKHQALHLITSESGLSEKQALEAFERLKAAKLVVDLDGCYLGLPMELDRYQPSHHILSALLNRTAEGLFATKLSRPLEESHYA
jgi:ribosomal peptide maturation radical SAM protein 1